MDSLGSRSRMRDASPTPDPSTHASRQSASKHGMKKRDIEELREVNAAVMPASSLGQFSFAPATRTTVVTTTTTTTTNFPPLVLNPPRSARQLDPRLYPLADNPTPSELRRFQFELGGQSVVFNEPDDTNATLDELNEQQEALRTSNGVLTSVAVYDGPSQKATAHTPAHQPSRGARFRHRHASPVSGSETARKTRSIVASSDSRGHTMARRSRLGRVASATHSSTLGLATPETEASHFRLDHHAVLRKRIHSERLGQKVTQDDTEASQTSNPRPPLFSGIRNHTQASSDITPISERRINSKQETRDTENIQSAPEGYGSGETMVEDNETGQESGPSVDQSFGPPNLPAIDSALSQDMCLPSPSLSPVTAMNTHNPDSFFEFTEDQGTDTDSSFDNQAPNLPLLTAQKASSSISANPTAHENALQSRSTSLMEIPATLDFFESIPDEMKTYMMYQLLRRCPKPTLQFVADVVNPALKCDFLALLPAELTLNIVRYLDLKSMCRAARVSKKWRHIINSDERAWKELFDRDGYRLPPGELQRAIKEGWGWQFPNGSDDWEKDLSVSMLKFDSDTYSADLFASGVFEDASSVGSPSRRPKRKAANRTSSRKLARRKLTSSHGIDSSAPTAVDWVNEATLLEGPYAAANAAATAVPYPEVGLSSLRSLHLYKSLYQRHFTIRRSWMRPDLKPKHLAFRAHDRHVVTCLQFDTEKILTGSDDTKIHVYDTHTGALKSVLSGHEGGVWALEYYGNTLVSGSTDRSVRVWDIEKAKCTQVFHGHTSTVRCLQILLPTEVCKNPDGTAEMMPKEPLIITGSRDSNLRVWKLPKPNEPTYLDAGSHATDTDCPYFLRSLSGHTHSVRAIAAHGDTLVSGSYDTTVRVWKISTGDCLHKLQGHTLKVYSVVLDVERNRCISGSMDNMVKIWSLDNGSLLHTLEGHTSLVGLLDLNSDRLVSAAADSTLRIWDPENGQCKSTLTAHTGAITCFQHDGEKVISGSDRTLKMWNVRTGECVKDLLKDLSGVWQVRFNERRCVAAVQRDGMTYIEVLDFGAHRDGFPDQRLGKRIIVDRQGVEIPDDDEDDYDATE
ncbi:putative cell division control protein Cdc4 [Talaromyces proteolyticus]|uniref:Probable E3 ubiquitin ligase complex SCF subunit sconB n=1 Tax=Talaromyces proteolyticus TaxID=1131652 RepID=A0AAD4Q0X2_9EURO|nr:putative cell division control protein Cdc4 [Talaromyces proteolyticus]KAH8701659.1 putative cell division control protein Cdc4 [Talaromyces proteolyticus]